MNILRNGLWSGLLLLLCSPALARHNPNAQAFYYQGFACGQSGHWEDAATNYKAALDLKPNWSAAEIGLGAAYNQLGQYGLAILISNDAIKNDPRSEQPYINLGSAYLKLQILPEAERAYDRAVQLAPDSVQGNYGVGLVEVQLHDAIDAIGMFKKVVRLKPDWPEGHEALGIAYMLYGDRQGAMKEHETLVSLDPTTAEKLKSTLDEIASDHASQPSVPPESPDAMRGGGAAQAIQEAQRGDWPNVAGYFVFSLIFAIPAAWFAHNRNRSPIWWGLATLFMPILCFALLGMPKLKKEATEEAFPDADLGTFRGTQAMPVMQMMGEQRHEAGGADRARIRNAAIHGSPNATQEGNGVTLLSTENRRRSRPTMRSMRQVQFPTDVSPSIELRLEQAATDSEGRIRCQNCGKELAIGEGAPQQSGSPKYVWDALGWNLPRMERTYLFNMLATAWWCLRCHRQEGREMIFGRQPYTQQPGPDYSNDFLEQEAFEEEEE